MTGQLDFSNLDLGVLLDLGEFMLKAAVVLAVGTAVWYGVRWVVKEMRNAP